MVYDFHYIDLRIICAPFCILLLYVSYPPKLKPKIDEIAIKSRAEGAQDYTSQTQGSMHGRCQRSTISVDDEERADTMGLADVGIRLRFG